MDKNFIIEYVTDSLELRNSINDWYLLNKDRLSLGVLNFDQVLPMLLKDGVRYCHYRKKCAERTRNHRAKKRILLKNENIK